MLVRNPANYKRGRAMSDASALPFEQPAIGLPALTGHSMMDEVIGAWRADSARALPSDAARFDRELFSATKLNFTTAAADAASHVVPDFILGADGKLRKNPDKKEPNKDGSVTVEIESGNKSEASAKKAANELQRQWARDMIQRWQSSPLHQGESVPQEWMDLVGKQHDLPSGGGGDAPQPKPSPNPTPEPSPEDIPGPPDRAPVAPAGTASGGGGYGGDGGGYSGGVGGSGAGGGDGGYSSGGGGGFGGADRPVQPAPTGDVPLHDVPGPVEPGKALAHLQAAIERANNGGAPVKVLQYGDSHVAGGVEPKAIEQALDAVAPTDYATKAQVGISATYPLQHPQEWLDQPLASNPDVVILSFGSNDSAGAVNKEEYIANYQKLVDNIRQRAPNADIVVVGPSDGDSITGANKGNTLPGLDTVVEAQKEVAQRNGLDFFDLRASMGGAGSIEQWHNQGLAADDKLHFTNAGYQKIGQAIGDHIKNGLHAR
jgi:lysophospholipase L1-like esterase